MSLIKLQGRLYIVQRGAVCGLFLLWGCLLLFPAAEALLFAIFGMVLAAAGIIDLESRRVSGLLCRRLSKTVAALGYQHVSHGAVYPGNFRSAVAE